MLLSRAKELSESSFQPDPRRDETLDEGEIDLIDDKTWLDSVHIDAALTLLRRQFSDVNGLFNVEWGATLSFAKAGKKWIQIIHNGKDHWVCVAQGIHSDAAVVYDSLSAGSATFKQETHVINCISCLAWSQADELTILNMACDKQANDYDCGVYAVAFTTALAFGRDPSGIQFDAPRLRSHLIDCLRRNRISPFPMLNADMKRYDPPSAMTLPLYCYCRRSDARLNRDWDMAKCRGNCSGWYHRICGHIPKSVFEEDDAWMCRLCVTNLEHEGS